MIRSKTIPRVLVLTLTVLVPTACSDLEAQKRDFVSSGDQYAARQEFREAIVEYRNAIAVDERYGEARHKLGRALLEVGAVGSAVGELVRAADLLPASTDVQLDAGRALLSVAQFEDARARADRVLAADPRHVDALVLRAAATANMRDLDGAIADLEQAIELDPSRSSSQITLGTIQAAGGLNTAAEAAFRRAVDLAPDSATAHLALANYFWTIGRRIESEASIRDALQVESTNLVANRSLAFLLVATGRAAEAEVPLRAIIDSTSDLEPRLVLADYYIAQNREADARAILEDLATRSEARAAAQVRLAGIEYAAGRRAEAYDIVEELLADEPNNVSVLVVRGGWLLQENRTDEALSTAQAAVAADPLASDAQGLLGAVHMSRRDAPQAIQAFTEVLKANPRALNAQLALAELYLSTGDAPAAARYAEEAVQNRPQSIAAHLALARAMLSQGRLDRAEAEVKVVSAADPDNPIVRTLAGQIQLRRGNSAGARASFERALSLDPTDLQALEGLVQLDLAAKRPADATRRVDATTAARPDDPRVLVIAGRTHAIARDFEKAEALLRKALELDAGFMQAYHVLGQVYVGQNRLNDARKEYESMADREPDNVAAHTMVAMILQVQNDWDAARTQYEKILQIDRRAPVAANNLAYMHAERATDLNRALSLAQTAKEGLPDEPDVDDTLGWVYYKKDMATLAVQSLERAVAADASNPIYQYHLGMAHLKAENFAKARAALEQALKLNPNFEGAADARRALATIQN